MIFHCQSTHIFRQANKTYIHISIYEELKYVLRKCLIRMRLFGSLVKIRHLGTLYITEKWRKLKEIDKMQSTIQPSVTLNLTNVTSANATTDHETSRSWCGASETYHCAVFFICSCIFGAGLLGNCVSIFFLTTKKRYRKNATFVSINLLCICDVLALTLTYTSDMFAGEDDWDDVDFTPLQCSVVIAFGLLPFLLSCYSVAVLALVRYNLVAYPLKESKLRLRKFIIILHIAGALVITLAMGGVGRMSLENMTCYEVLNSNGYFAFTHPPIILGTIAFLITLHALKVRRLRMSLSAKTNSIKASIRRINIIIYMVMCMFIICQLPYVVFDVLQLLNRFGVLEISDEFFNILHNVGTVFYTLNHAVNPYIYFISYLCFQQRPTAEPASLRSSIRSVTDTRASIRSVTDSMRDSIRFQRQETRASLRSQQHDSRSSVRSMQQDRTVS